MRVCRPGGTIGVLSWAPDGMIGSLFATMKPFAPPPPPGASPPPLWGDPEHLAALLGGRVEVHTSRRDHLEVTSFVEARGFGEHFKAYYGPTIGVRANADRNGLAADFDSAIDAFCDQWDLGRPGAARFEMTYQLTVGTRVG